MDEDVDDDDNECFSVYPKDDEETEIEDDELIALGIEYAYCDLSGEIELEDDEEFDIDKLTVFDFDNDTPFVDVEGFCECVRPIIKYGNKFYKLELDDFDIKRRSGRIGTWDELRED